MTSCSAVDGLGALHRTDQANDEPPNCFTRRLFSALVLVHEWPSSSRAQSEWRAVAAEFECRPSSDHLDGDR